MKTMKKRMLVIALLVSANAAAVTCGENQQPNASGFCEDVAPEYEFSNFAEAWAVLPEQHKQVAIKDGCTSLFNRILTEVPVAKAQATLFCDELCLVKKYKPITSGLKGYLKSSDYMAASALDKASQDTMTFILTQDPGMTNMEVIHQLFMPACLKTGDVLVPKLLQKVTDTNFGGDVNRMLEFSEKLQ